MPRVVADAGPPHYLILIGAIDLLRRLFGAIVIPDAVRHELTHPKAPGQVREWISAPPVWFRVADDVPTPRDTGGRFLADGERAAIALALVERADVILMDDRAGVGVARARGLRAIGTLGILEMASQRRWINLAEAVARLRDTNFRAHPTLLRDMVDRAARRDG